MVPCVIPFSLKGPGGLKVRLLASVTEPHDDMACLAIARYLILDSLTQVSRHICAHF